MWTRRIEQFVFVGLEDDHEEATAPEIRHKTKGECSDAEMLYFDSTYPKSSERPRQR